MELTRRRIRHKRSHLRDQDGVSQWIRLVLGPRRPDAAPHVRVYCAGEMVEVAGKSEVGEDEGRECPEQLGGVLGVPLRVECRGRGPSREL